MLLMLGPVRVRLQLLSLEALVLRYQLVQLLGEFAVPAAAPAAAAAAVCALNAKEVQRVQHLAEAHLGEH